MTTPDQGTGGAGAAPPSLADLYAAFEAACAAWVGQATGTEARVVGALTHQLHRAIDREAPLAEQVGRHYAVDMTLASVAEIAMVAAVARSLPAADYAPNVIRSLRAAGFDITYTPKPGG